MMNLVGKKHPSEREVRTIVELLVNLRKKRLAPYTCELTLDERKKQLRVRPGWEGVSLEVVKTANRAGLVLPVSTRDIVDDMALIAALGPIAAEMRLALNLVEDTIMRAQHEAWYGTTAHYTSLQRLAGADREIEASLARVVAFFAVGSRQAP
jgi:hypothetical protein